MTHLSFQRKITNKTSLEHINSVDLAIKFTVEDIKEDGAIPFLDAIVKPEANGGLSITVYRKPTHMDQYLEWDSHHHLSAKYSVINTLTQRAKTVCKPTTNEVKTKGHIVILYTWGLCKSIKKICSKYGIQTHFKGNSTIKNLLVSPKDKEPMESKSGAIY